MKTTILLSWLLAIVLAAPLLAADPPPAPTPAQTVDLLQRYPTSLTASDTDPTHARAWEFTGADVFRLTQFQFAVGTNFNVAVGSADVGIGHCADGAVWAVVLPRDQGTLTSSAAGQPEAVAHVWLRFHPREINRLFPPATVFSDGATNTAAQMRLIAGSKMNSSWQAGGRAMIPGPNDLTVDADTRGGLRRFFIVDTEAGTVEYVDAFQARAVKLPPVLTRDLAAAAFDQLWSAFDEKYAMFVLRPEVDWAKLRDQYRPQALASQSTYELAGVCADMLRNLRDLHVWLTVAGTGVPVFNRPRASNVNPRAAGAIVGDVDRRGAVAWGVTSNQIGYLAIYSWSSDDIPRQCGEALEHLRNTRGLVVDVRANGGGSEPLAEEVAGRFLTNNFIYAFDQFRDGPSHTNLTARIERSVAPRGPWRYDRPVVLLIGQKCMSSNESFIGMMTGDPDLTTMGDHTCGSSGNPDIIHLPLDLTVSVPQWIDYLPDGTVLDERGFQPQVPFTTTPEAFTDNRDDLLTAALNRLAAAPLPEKPIAGPTFGD